MSHLHFLAIVEYEEEARMLKTSQSRKVYNLFIIIFSLLLYAQTQAETTADSTTQRPLLRQNSEPRQPWKRNPSALHSEPTQKGRTLDGASKQIHSPVESKPSTPNTSGLSIRPLESPSAVETLLKGRAEKWIGNFIPSRGSRPNSSKTLLRKTKIHIYKEKIKSDGNAFFPPLANGPKVFSVVNSDDQGQFQVRLPPGEYTIFIELEDGKLYRNSFDGKGYFSTVKLVSGEDTFEVLTDSRDAIF